MSPRPDCDELRSRLNEVVEEDLRASIPVDDRERLLEHARGCAECGELLRSYRDLLGDLAALPRMRAPADLVKRVQAAIDGDRGTASAEPAAMGRFFRSGLVRFMARAAALLAVAAGGWLTAQFVLERDRPAPAEVARAPEALRRVAAPDTIRLAEPPPAAEATPAALAEGAEVGILMKETKTASDKAEDFAKLAVAGARPLLEKKGEREVDGGALRSKVEEGARLIVFALPPQSPDRLGTLLAFARSIDPAAEVEDLSPLRRRIAFDVDAAEAPRIREALLPFSAAKAESAELADGASTGAPAGGDRLGGIDSLGMSREAEEEAAPTDPAGKPSGAGIVMERKSGVEDARKDRYSFGSGGAAGGVSGAPKAERGAAEAKTLGARPQSDRRRGGAPGVEPAAGAAGEPAVQLEPVAGAPASTPVSAPASAAPAAPAAPASPPAAPAVTLVAEKAKGVGAPGSLEDRGDGEGRPLFRESPSSDKRPVSAGVSAAEKPKPAAARPERAKRAAAKQAAGEVAGAPPPGGSAGAVPAELEGLVVGGPPGEAAESADAEEPAARTAALPPPAAGRAQEALPGQANSRLRSAGGIATPMPGKGGAERLEEKAGAVSAGEALHEREALGAGRVRIEIIVEMP